jgi:putative transcriptional regulator
VPNFKVSDVIVRQGGPVQADTMQMLHRIPEILGGTEVCKGIYWGGSYAALQQLFISGAYNPSDIQLFMGYACWTTGQLDKELDEGAWMIADTATDWLFDAQPAQVWRNAVKLLGKDYEYIANMPIDPLLN